MEGDFLEEEEKAIEKEKLLDHIAGLQRGYYLRILAIVLFLVFGALSIKVNGPGFLYFLKIGSKPINIGNARELVAKGTRFLDLPSDSYVKVDALMITGPANTKVYNFFFSPLLNLVVRTKLPLGRPSMRESRYTVPKGLVFLLQERKVMPEDFTTNFNATGRLIKLQDYSAWKGGLHDFYGDLVKGNESKSYILLDGDTPFSDIWDALALFALAFGLLLSIFLMLRQRKALILAHQDLPANLVS